jgi:hypothetical protein
VLALVTIVGRERDSSVEANARLPPHFWQPPEESRREIPTTLPLDSDVREHLS